MEAEVDPARKIARTARAQCGDASREQLVAAGFGRGAIAQRLRTARPHAVHRGVYAVDHLHLTHEARWLTATLACGHGALLSHRDAAALWERPHAQRPRGDAARPLRRARSLARV